MTSHGTPLEEQVREYLRTLHEAPDGVPRSLAEQELAEWEEYVAYRERQAQVGESIAKYAQDPLGFIYNFVDFPPRKDGKGGLTPYQEEVIGSLPEKKRIAVRGPHGLGKTTVSSLVVLWFALTRDAQQRDWKCVTTAGAWRQLEKFLWPEIRKWARLLKWEKLGRPEFDSRRELMKLTLSLKFGEAFAAASDKPELIEGAHAMSILYIFDESKSILSETFDAAEGAFSGAGEDTDDEALALAASTPGEPAGRFFEIHRRKPGTEDWHPRHVTLDEAIAAGRVSRDWASQRAKLWGIQTAVYQNRVLGEFYSSDEDAVVPLAWVEAANDRYRQWEEAGKPDSEPHVIGVDVARSGLDKTILAIRHGDVVAEIRATSREDTMMTAGRVKGLLDADSRAQAIVDVIGIGAGVVDRLREQDAPVLPFHASAATKRRDATGELGFVNLRAAAAWNLREMLDPSRGATLALPPDDELLGDLTSLHWKPVTRGSLQVESKDDIRKRLGRSTDRGDAVSYACWVGGVSPLDEYGITMCANTATCGRGFLRVADGVRRTECPYCRTPVAEEIQETTPAPADGTGTTAPIPAPASAGIPQAPAPDSVMLPVSSVPAFRQLGGLRVWR